MYMDNIVSRAIETTYTLIVERKNVDFFFGGGDGWGGGIRQIIGVRPTILFSVFFTGGFFPFLFVLR